MNDGEAKYSKALSMFRDRKAISSNILWVVMQQYLEEASAIPLLTAIGWAESNAICICESMGEVTFAKCVRIGM